jgi:crossover junction endodeoxyribonuclease RuvC
MDFTVIGIDPGINSTGYGLIRFNNLSEFIHIESGTINPKSTNSMEIRLVHIFSGLSALIEKHRPDIMAVEKVFAGKNINSSIILSYSRASALLAAGMHRIPVREYNPTKVKSYLSGHAFAGKSQVAFIIQKILRINGQRLKSDASDALAIAFCGGLEYSKETVKAGIKL